MFWKTIPQYPDYEVSSCGLVRKIRNTRYGKPFVLSARPDRAGYQQVAIWEAGHHSGGRGIPRPVHRLVAFAHIGPPPSDRHVVAHLDGVASNNAVENLRWVTPEENEAHKEAHGTKLLGERHHQAILVEADVLEIRRLWVDGWTALQLGDRFGVTYTTARNAALGRTWKHVPTK